MPAFSSLMPVLDQLKPIADVKTSTTVSFVDFTGLSINRDKCYLLIAYIYNPLSTATAYYLLIENVTTATSYFMGYVEGSAGGAGANTLNEPIVAYAEAGSHCLTTSFIFRNPGGGMMVNSVYGRINIYGGLAAAVFVRSNFTVPDITRIRIASKSADGIGANSRFILYRLGGP
jgi:hypothetical protein